jgi:predicted acyl esterase
MCRCRLPIYTPNSSGAPVVFETQSFEEETEFTGHPVAHINVSCSTLPGGNTPSDIDLFVTIRHIGPDGKEGKSATAVLTSVFYTGTAGDPVPVTKGWLRVSLRKVDSYDPVTHCPVRTYLSTDVQKVEPGEIYPVDVEIWPTNVVVEKGAKLQFEIAAADTQGSGLFLHNHPDDRYAVYSCTHMCRPDIIFKGLNHIHFGKDTKNYIRLPVIPPK